MKEKGKLFLCATPIGNLADISRRFVATLEDCDIIAAEDTSHSRKLLSYTCISKKLVSYHEHNKETRGKELIDLLLSGSSIALLSDAGHPGISDPGEQLVAMAVAEGITVVPVPGASALLCALTASGLESTPFFFGGFLPKTKKHRLEKLRMWQSIPATIVLYEAPHRLKEVLGDIMAVWGNRRIVLAREMTKLYEEFFRGDLEQSIAWLEKSPPRGEFTLVIEKASGDASEIERPPAMERLKALIASGEDKKESLKKVAKEYNMPRRDLYKELLEQDDVGGM